MTECKHEWIIDSHSSGGEFNNYWAGGIFICTKCENIKGELINTKTGEKKNIGN